MSEENLPLTIDPFRFADNAICLQGSFFLENMKRLVPSLGQKEGRVQVMLQFGVDEQGTRFLSGELSTELPLICQRCLGSFAFPVQERFLAGIVHTDEEAEKLSKRYDPLIVKDGILQLREVVEDELIIGLPIVPVHTSEDQCKVKMPYVLDLKPEDDKDNPFKVIEVLRTKNPNNSSK